MKNNNVRLVLLALVLAGGFAAVWGVAVLWATDVFQSIQGADMGDLLSFHDGKPVIVRGSRRRGGSRYYDLDGRRIPESEVGPLAMMTSSWPARFREPTDAEGGRHARVTCYADGLSPRTYWYFVTDGLPGGAGWFEGFDRESKRRVGYLGVGGFRETPPDGDDCFRAAPGDFPQPLGWEHQRQNEDSHRAAPPHRDSLASWEVAVCCAGKVYRVDLRAREVRLVVQDPQLRMVSLLIDDPFDPRGSPFRLAIRLDEAIVVLDREGRALGRYAIAPALRDKGFILSQSRSRAVVMWRHDPAKSLGQRLWRICWSPLDGPYRESELMLRDADFALLPLQGLMLPSPLLVCGSVAFGRTRTLLQYEHATTFSEAFARALADYWPALLVAQVIATVLSLLCYLRQRRYAAGRGECIGWALFVIVLGLPGWVGYRFCRSWPPLERCPGCDGVVPRDRDACARCEAAFPAPALRGTEVFA
jgi:hypothetical protein